PLPFPNPGPGECRPSVPTAKPRLAERSMPGGRSREEDGAIEPWCLCGGSAENDLQGVTLGYVGWLPVLHHAPDGAVRHRSLPQPIATARFRLAGFAIDDRRLGLVVRKEIDESTAQRPAEIGRVPDQWSARAQRNACALARLCDHRSLRRSRVQI